MVTLFRRLWGCFFVLSLLAWAVACAPAAETEPAAESLPSNALSDSQTPDAYPPPPTATPTLPPYPWPTATPEPPAPPEPTIPPTETIPPVPTLPPTPAVTVVPTAAPPMIPFPEGTTSQPFTLYWRDGEVIRSLSSTGEEEATVFLDPATEFGLYLAPEYAQFPFRDWGELSPDGQLVALVLAEVPESVDPNYEDYSMNVYILNQKTRELHLLAKNAVEPVWSPDGHWLAYLSSDNWSLLVADIESGKTIELYTPDGDRNNPHVVRGHVWAPDSRRMALIDELPMQMAALIVLDVEQPGNVRNLTEFTMYPLGNPQWSPSGESVAFSWSAGEGGEGSRLWSIDVITGTETQITKGLDVDGDSPQWSSDGQWIVASAFMPYENEGSPRDIWLVNTQGGDIQRLTADVETSAAEINSRRYPAWSPGGTEVIYIKLIAEEDRREIWSLSLIDGSQRRLVGISRPFDIGLELTHQKQAGGQ